MSSPDLTVLMDMGFSKVKVEKALIATGNKGVEAAMEWLLAHPDCDEVLPEVLNLKSETMPTTDNDSGEPDANTSDQLGSPNTAKSIKCDVCGKLFKTNLEIEFHATKSGHDKFSESREETKILTEEEKKEQLRILEEKLKQKRKEREEKEKVEALEKEKIRIRSGKEMSQAKKKLEELEMKKLLDQRKREKEEDRLTRQRIKEQIEADKAARRLKGAVAIDSKVINSPPPIAAPSASATNEVQKDYNNTKLQIRLTNGQVLIQTFGSKEQLSAVRLYIEMNRTDDPGLFSLITSFPRRVYNDSDYDTPLDVLGLVPSAVIMVQKK